jgi:excisionase family DNA binding protein
VRTSSAGTSAAHDPAELLSGSEVARLLHRDKQEVLDLIASGAIPSLWTGKVRRVPRWALIEWQRRQVEDLA